MNDHGCDREMELTLALRRGEVADELREHARECPDCAEAARVSVLINSLAATTPRDRAPLDPMVLFLKAQILATASGESRALGPLHLLQRIALALVALGWAVLLTWKWDAIRAFSFEGALASAIGGASVSPSLVALVFGLGCATILVTVQAALAD